MKSTNICSYLLIFAKKRNGKTYLKIQWSGCLFRELIEDRKERKDVWLRIAIDFFPKPIHALPIQKKKKNWKILWTAPAYFSLPPIRAADAGTLPSPHLSFIWYSLSLAVGRRGARCSGKEQAWKAEPSSLASPFGLCHLPAVWSRLSHFTCLGSDCSLRVINKSGGWSNG